MKEMSPNSPDTPLIFVPDIPNEGMHMPPEYPIQPKFWRPKEDAPELEQVDLAAGYEQMPYQEDEIQTPELEQHERPFLSEDELPFAERVRPFHEYREKNPVEDYKASHAKYWWSYDDWTRDEHFGKPDSILPHFVRLHEELARRPDLATNHDFLARLASTRSALQLALDRPETTNIEQAIFDNYREQSDPLLAAYVGDTWVPRLGHNSPPAWAVDTIRRVITPKLNGESVLPRRQSVIASHLRGEDKSHASFLRDLVHAPAARHQREETIERFGTGSRKHVSNSKGTIHRGIDDRVSFLMATDWARRLGFTNQDTMRTHPSDLWASVAKEVKGAHVKAHQHDGIPSSERGVEDWAREYLRGVHKQHRREMIQAGLEEVVRGWEITEPARAAAAAKTKDLGDTAIHGLATLGDYLANDGVDNLDDLAKRLEEYGRHQAS
jgi:hypothetical protein